MAKRTKSSGVSKSATKAASAIKRASAKSTKSTTSSATGKNHVTVRMFCHGLGDCFLVTFPIDKKTNYNLLIDCGVAKSAPDAAHDMPDVVRQIAKLTGGTIDLLVVTHEHWDHVSGFAQAAEEFAKLEVKHLWLAWTEDPRDKAAQTLRKDHQKAKLALANAFAAASAPGAAPALGAIKTGLEGILQFWGPGDELPVSGRLGAAAKKGALGTADALDIAKGLVKHAGNDGISYLRPDGKVISLAGAQESSFAGQVKVRVLGPPLATSDIHKLNSTTETFHKEARLQFDGAPWTWTTALNQSSDVLGDGLTADEHELERAMPFDARERIPIAEAAKQAFFREHYFEGSAPPPDQPASSLASRANTERRIDGDWLARGAEQLALALNSYTNNISLVLAIELPKSGKVLLFVGDAQVGNWLSWHKLEFEDDEPAKKGEAKKPLTMTDLFAKTVLYKVGHHGSHNATLKQKGLELMTHPELVAMLPVDHEQAAKLSYGEMPLNSLVKSLKEHSDKRLLQIDEPWTGDDPPGEWPKQLIPPKCTTVSTDAKGVKFMEYTIVDQ